MYTQFITHAGKAHRDDFITACLLIAAFGKTPIRRVFAVTEEELEDKSVLVFDIGMRYELKWSNFDHHQLAPEAGKCSLSLVCDAMVVGCMAETVQPYYAEGARAVKQAQWYAFTVLTDAQGIIKACDSIGISTPNAETMSPIEQAVMQLFEDCKEITEDSDLMSMMSMIGSKLFEQSVTRLESIESMMFFHNRITVDGVHGVVYQTKAVQEHSFLHKSAFPDCAFAVFPSNRGEGWTLYRYDDNERIDFSRLAGVEGISFAHKGGFLASTETMCDENQIAQFVLQSLR